MGKDLTIYVQQWQGNGYYPTYCYKRVNGVWSCGAHKTSKGENYFNMLECSHGDSYYWYLFEHNPFIFSTEPIWSSNIMHKGNITRDEVKKLIFDEVAPALQ